ncbi:uncharacterized protein LOC113515360 isoform X2 [Galleria mellonella]|uniref:Uncharacterized protein LOC113515360 isoform X2 n=1 Tax=Galleria mellonella TaxID=7137 RepID=A0ABM3MCZ2_GALME|nr:uncharacterized protein LOC113515360 isoform X2 [Galleria mellonella]
MGRVRIRVSPEEQQKNERTSATQLNPRNRQLPPWPQPRSQTEKMFLIPKELNPEDEVSIQGTVTNNPNSLTFNVTVENGDYYQLEVNFVENRLFIRKMEENYTEDINGRHENMQATDLLSGLNFNLGFTCGEKNGIGYYIQLKYDGYPLEEFEINNSCNKIRYISLDGDVERVNKLEFMFS